MKRLWSLILSMALCISSVTVVRAEETNKTIFNTVQVEFSDSEGKTEDIQVMVQDNNVYVNAEDIGTRLGYQVSVSNQYVSIYNKEKDTTVPYGLSVFYFDTPKIGHMLFDKMVEYKAVFSSVKNEKGAWIPFEQSLLLLNSSVVNIDNTLVIDMPEKNIVDIFMDVAKENKKYLLDWQNDIGITEKNVKKMGLSAYYVVMFKGLLDGEGASWQQFLESFQLNTTAYDSKYGEQLAMLFCTYSDDELKQEVEKMQTFMSYFNGENALAKTISAIEKQQENTIAGFQQACKELKEKIDVNNPRSIALYNRSCQALDKACDEADALSKATGLYTKVGKEISKATSFLDAFYKVADVVGYAKEFQNQDKFAVDTLLDFIANSDSESVMSKTMKKKIKQYANTLKTNVASYSALRFLEENYDDLIAKAVDLGSSLTLEAKLALIAWDLASSSIPFYKDGLAQTDSFILSMYADIFLADAFVSYQNIRNTTFQDEKNINAEQLYQVSRSCYTYLKSCYIKRDAALGALTDETNQSASSVVNYQKSINQEIAGYLVRLKDADQTNENLCYGFLPEDNEEYLRDYSGDKLAEVCSIDTIDVTDCVGKWDEFIRLKKMQEDDNPMYEYRSKYLSLNFLGENKESFILNNLGDKKVSVYGIKIGDSYQTAFKKMSGEKLCYDMDGGAEGYEKTIYLWDDIGADDVVEINFGLDSNKNIESWSVNNWPDGMVCSYYASAIQSAHELGLNKIEDWQVAYLTFIDEDYVENYGQNCNNYQLIYINEDDIPELYINYGSTAGGAKIVSYNAGKIFSQYLYVTGLTYLEKQNLFRDSGGHMDAYYDKIYSIQNGQFVLTASGEYGAENNSNVQIGEDGKPIYNYYWNDEKMTEQEYKEYLQKNFDEKNAVSANGEYNEDTGMYEGFYGFSDIAKQIIYAAQ